MSMASGRVTCTGCDFRNLLQYRPMQLVYRLHDGTEVETERIFGWCESCNCIRDIEISMDGKKIRAKLEDLRKQARTPALLISKVFGSWLGGRANELKEEITDLEDHLRLSQARRSSPRCLMCGGEDTKSLSFDDHGLSLDFVHECGGRLKKTPSDPDAPKFSYRPIIVFLDQEGRTITP